MANEKLIFEIGFDLDGAVQVAIKDGKKAITKIQKELGKTPIQLDVDTKSLRAELKKLNDVWNKLSASQRAGVEGTKLREQYRALTLEANGYTSTLRSAVSAEDKATAAKQRSASAIERQNSAYKTQSTYLSRLVQRMVAYASVTQAFSFLRNIREVTAEFELQRVALGSIIGDLNEANAMFEQIKAAAVKSPFQIKELVTYTKQLAAYKIETDELFETTQRLADISAGLGVGMERLVLAYGQIRATGYLRASEVRQLTEAGIPIVEELAKKMSELRGETVSAAEVMGMISDRAISFGMVKEVFDDMTSAGGMFYKMQEKQAETLAGQWSNLKDSIAIMYEEIGNTEGVNNSIKGMIGLVKSLADNWQLLGNILKITAYQYGVMYAVSLFIPRLVQSTKLLQKAEEAHAKAKQMSNVATQRGSAIMAFSAKQSRIYAYWMRQAANAHTMFGRGVKRLAAMFLGGGWIGAVIGVLTVAVSWFISARKEAKRLNEELAKIGTEGALQADQSVRNFERLARAVRESADGSARQTEALEEMKRAYGEFLPSQDESIINLVREKDGYNAVTQAIREKIALQIQEQKLNTIASEYGSQFTKWEEELKESWFLKDFSKEEISLIIADIKNAVNEGLIASTNDIEDNMMKVRDIVRNITGSTLSQEALYRLFEGGLLYKGYITELIRVQENYNSQIQDVENSMESATGSLGKYTRAYKAFKEELKDVTGTGEKFSFEWNESKTKEEIKAYNKFIGDLLAKEGIKFDIGEAIDFKGLYEALGDNYPQLKQVVATIQREYEKLIPTDITRLANDKLQEYADKVGVSMDDVKEHLKTNEQSTEDWANGLKDAYESLEKKLAEYKLNRDNAISIGKKSHWSKEVERVENEMEVLKLLMDYFKDFLPQSGGGKKTNPRIALLNEELSTVEKIYKEYQELRKFMRDDDARARIADMFEGVNLTMLSQALSPTEMQAQLQKALDEAKKMGDKAQILELEYKLGKFDADDAQRQLEQSMRDLSDKISRTKTAKEFFDRMLGMTGDKELSATLTLSVYGTTGDDLQRLITRQVEEAFKDLPEGFDITKAMIGDGKFDYNLLESWIEHLPKEQRENAQSIVDNWRKANADILTDLQKSYEDFMTYEERKKRVAEKYAAERKKIMESKLPEAEKDKYVKATNEREGKELADIAIEEFKASEDWAKSFEDLENLATPTIERLMAKLKEFIDTQEDLTPEQLRTLMNEYNKLYNGLIARNPIQAITDSIKEYKLAIANIQDIQRQLDFARELGDDNLIAQIERDLTDAFDEAQKATSKLQKGLSGVSDEFSQAQQFVSSFADTLGISEDTEFGAFLGGISDALGGVSKAFSFAMLAVQLFDGSIKAMLASNPIGWILLAVSAIISAVQAIGNARVKHIDKDIEILENRLDSLSYAYERLQKAQEKAFGTDYISNYEQRMANLVAQQDAYLKQAELERSKGKKADEDKIKEYEEQARDTADAIKDMQSELSEHFLGTDLTSAARDFANAWIDAYKEFGSTTDAMKDKFQDMIQNMIVESFAARVIQTALEPIFDSIDNMTKDGVLDMSEASKIADMTEVAVGNIDVGMNNLMNALSQAGLSVRGMGSNLTGISRDIATASEESILGLAAGINTQNFYISQVPTKLDTIIGLLRGENAMQGSTITLQDLVTMQNQHLSHLPSIAQHTAETVAECKAIVVETRRTANALERVIKPRGTQSTYTINATLN